MKNILAFLKLACVLSIGLAGFHTFAAKLSPCERALFSFSENQILSDIGDLLARAGIPEILNDEVNPLMGLFEPVTLRAIDVGHEEELQTARDYATYLHNKYGQRFVFARTFRNTFIPILDGLALEDDGTPAFNVSLKYIAAKVSSMDQQTLYVRLHGRMNPDRNMLIMGNLFEWLKAVNNWQGQEGLYFIKNYRRDLERGALLAYIFGVNNPRHIIGRQLETVVDMRYSGYPYEFVNRPGYISKIERMVERRGHGVLRLTLLWDAEQVLEFGR